MTDLDSLSGEFAEKFVDGGWIHVTGPKEWKPESDEVMYRTKFWTTLRRCLDKLPDRVAPGLCPARSGRHLQQGSCAAIASGTKSRTAEVLGVKESLDLTEKEKLRRTLKRPS